MSRRFSDSLDLSQLGLVPYDIASQQQAERNRADFAATNARCDEQCRRFEDDGSFLRDASGEAHSVLTAPAPPFDWRGFLIGLCGLVTVLALGVAARFLWDDLTLEGRLVAGCFGAWVAVLVWRRMGGQGR